ncbi:MAG TPA: hypothetical protein VMM84_06355 [Pyrinomonadaceae bacterium]|nr:hypothetical protein [Pyrinomonadaceae bacterium]
MGGISGPACKSKDTSPKLNPPDCGCGIAGFGWVQGWALLVDYDSHASYRFVEVCGRTLSLDHKHIETKEKNMRVLMNIRVPHEPFNTAVRKGTAGTILQSIIEEAKPEAVYFLEQNGTRGAVMVVQVNDSSEIPALAEPWFLNFNADCEFRIAMTPPDLEKAGLDKIAEKWR